MLYLIKSSLFIRFSILVIFISFYLILLFFVKFYYILLNYLLTLKKRTASSDQKECRVSGRNL